MPQDAPSEVTILLRRWSNGDDSALRELIPIVYDELRRLAHRQLDAERPGHTLQSTALVNEACIRLLGSEPPDLKNRGHFIGVASRLIRQILVDYARKRQASKRDGGCRIDIEALANLPIADDAQLVRLDDALQALSHIDDRQAKVVDMKFFGGMSLAEISEVLNISHSTVERDWETARIWLHRQMVGT